MKDENKCAKLEIKDYSAELFKLQKIFQNQKKLQDRVKNKYYDIVMGERIVKAIYMKECVNGEFTELLERLPWKTWKKYDDVKLNILDPQDEIETFYEWIDMLHFLVNFAIFVGIPDPDPFEKQILHRQICSQRYYLMKNDVKYQNWNYHEKAIYMINIKYYMDRNLTTIIDMMYRHSKFDPLDPLKLVDTFTRAFQIFLRIGIILRDIDANMVFNYYVAKNKENFDRQDRGY